MSRPKPISRKPNATGKKPYEKGGKVRKKS